MVRVYLCVCVGWCVCVCFIVGWLWGFVSSPIFAYLLMLFIHCFFLFLYTYALSLFLGGPKVYDVTKYLDDHPGGAEVMLDVAGQNADEFFEDIGHSKEARNELSKYLIGQYRLTPEELEKMKADAEKKASQGGSSSMMMVVLVALIAIYIAYTQWNS
jgi:cytochrome b5